MHIMKFDTSKMAALRLATCEDSIPGIPFFGWESRGPEDPIRIPPFLGVTLFFFRRVQIVCGV